MERRPAQLLYTVGGFPQLGDERWRSGRKVREDVLGEPLILKGSAESAHGGNWRSLWPCGLRRAGNIFLIFLISMQR
jgi:hypothetical protein